MGICLELTEPGVTCRHDVITSGVDVSPAAVITKRCPTPGRLTLELEPNPELDAVDGPSPLLKPEIRLYELKAIVADIFSRQAEARSPVLVPPTRAGGVAEAPRLR